MKVMFWIGGSLAALGTVIVFWQAGIFLYREHQDAKALKRRTALYKA